MLDLTQMRMTKRTVCLEIQLQLISYKAWVPPDSRREQNVLPTVMRKFLPDFHREPAARFPTQRVTVKDMKVAVPIVDLSKVPVSLSTLVHQRYTRSSSAVAND